MIRISLIGCGFLGSLWAEEVFKRLYAIDRGDVSFWFVDRDRWEPRNAANQIITVKDGELNGPKAMTLCDRAKAYFRPTAGFAVEDVKKLPDTIRRDDEVPQIIVDALDNLDARWSVYYKAMEWGVPLMHLGVNSGGSGSVEWSLPEHDYWHMSPLKVAIQSTGELPPAPPCHLVQSRGLGLNLAVAGAKALTLALGEDIEELLGHGPQPGFVVYSGWEANHYGHSLNREQIHVETQEAATKTGPANQA